MKKIKRILITAGPTREMLDPVRFLSNVSTGEMGYALARAAKVRGYTVSLVSGPTHLRPPAGVSFIPIVSASDMKKACEKLFPKMDAIIMTAAVCDFTAAKVSHHKIHRATTKEFHLMQTPDILAGLGRRKKHQLVIGFCLETQEWLESAKKKIAAKCLDGIVANYYNKKHIPFGNRRINTAFVEPSGSVNLLKNKSKKQISGALLSWAESLYKYRFSKESK